MLATSSPHSVADRFLAACVPETGALPPDPSYIGMTPPELSRALLTDPAEVIIVNLLEGYNGLAAARVASRHKTAGEVRFIKDKGSDHNEWGWGNPGPSEREIDEGFEFKPKYLKPLAETLRSALMALGHATSAHSRFVKIKSRDVSPDGALGGKGYIQKIPEMRRQLMNCVEVLSSLTDTLHDELQAPHWDTDTAGGGNRERGQVENIMDDAEEIKDDPEEWAEDQEDEMDSDHSKTAAKVGTMGGPPSVRMSDAGIQRRVQKMLAYPSPEEWASYFPTKGLVQLAEKQLAKLDHIVVRSLDWLKKRAKGRAVTLDSDDIKYTNARGVFIRFKVDGLEVARLQVSCDFLAKINGPHIVSDGRTFPASITAVKQEASAQLHLLTWPTKTAASRALSPWATEAGRFGTVPLGETYLSRKPASDPGFPKGTKVWVGEIQWPGGQVDGAHYAEGNTKQWEWMGSRIRSAQQAAKQWVLNYRKTNPDMHFGKGFERDRLPGPFGRQAAQPSVVADRFLRNP